MEFIAHDSKTGLFLCWTIQVMSWRRKSKYVSLSKRLFGVPVSPNNIQNQYTHASNAYHLVTVYCWFARDVTAAILVVKKLYFHVDCKTVGFFLKFSKEIGKAWRKSLTRVKPSLALCFQPRPRPFVWLLARSWIRRNTDCFALWFSCKFLEKKFYFIDPQHGRLVTWLQTKIRWNFEFFGPIFLCFRTFIGTESCTDPR